MASVLARLGPQASVGCGFAVGVGAASALVHALGAHGTDVHTAGQFAVAILGVVTVGAWTGAEWGLLAGAGGAPAGAAYELVAKGPDDVERAAAAAPPGSPTRGLSPPPRAGVARWLDRDVATSLRHGSEFALWIAFMYLCDRTDLVPRGAKHTDPRSFWLLWLAICVAAACSLRSCRSPKVLAREQTEEWKGWMQLMFLLYHYFAQGQLYNAIRVYIAGYVWMTGYGNFLYYRKSGDFGAVRVCQTLFRLNFFVVTVCVALRNEYMLYYIAPMHTLFTLFVWLALRVAKDRNGDDAVAAGKIVATLAATALLYDVEPVFKAAFGWRPLRDLVAFHDPLHPEFSDELHEWHFRSGLDRYIWIFGMACALGLPSLERRLGALAALDDGARRVAAHGAAACVALAPAVAWVALVFLKDKYAYNALHPYTSWVPVACYIVLRNLTPGLRSTYLHLFTFLGKVTLETYILQFHIWMKTTGLNGSPKFLLVVVEGHFWLNFAVVSAAYFFVSVRVFRLTVALRDALIPDDGDDLPKALLALGAAAAAVAAAGHGLRALLPVDA